MGWCHEFGVTVREGCGHPMTAGESSCQCDVCGLVCKGEFAGCSRVWAKGPREVTLVRPEESSSGRRAPYLAPLDVVGEAVDEVTATSSAPRPRVRPATSSASRSTAIHVEVAPTGANGDSHLQPPGAARLTTPPTTDAPLPVVAAEEIRGQVFEWLHESFDGLRSQLRMLNDAVSRQQRALDSLTEDGPASERASTSPAAPADRPTDSAPTPRRPINHAGWQERLRALRPAGSQPSG